MRFTVVGDDGTISFIGPCHAIKMLVAGCTRDPRTWAQLLENAQPYDQDFIGSVQSGLAVFAEHNTEASSEAIDRVLDSAAPLDLPPFRVLGDRTREASLTPAGTGLILFNLRERRIVQVQNSYAEVLRADRGRIRRNGRPTRMLYHYTLPEEWRLLP
jgi:hypothetical protein